HHVFPHTHLSLAFHGFPAHRHLPSFPTRRSSDLEANQSPFNSGSASHPPSPLHRRAARLWNYEGSGVRFTRKGKNGTGNTLRLRSEEHTSELQSQSNLVCRLLLEKKNDRVTSGAI